VLAAAKPPPAPSIVWNGLTWTIKTSSGPVGPGPNRFDRSNVSVDASGHLHLRITKNAVGQWTCAEIIAPQSYGYGTYTFGLGSRVDALDPRVVLATDPTNAQYVVQPYDRPGHLMRFTQPPIDASTHRFIWQPGRVTWESYNANGGLIDDYTYAGAEVPKPGDERVHVNLWLYQGVQPSDSNSVDVKITSFSYVR
jgi:hypothetical protein